MKETYKSCSLKKTLKTANAASLTNVKNYLIPTILVLFQWYFCGARINTFYKLLCIRIFSFINIICLYSSSLLLFLFENIKFMVQKTAGYGTCGHVSVVKVVVLS